MSVHPSVLPSVRPSVCPSIHLSVRGPRSDVLIQGPEPGSLGQCLGQGVRARRPEPQPTNQQSDQRTVRCMTHRLIMENKSRFDFFLLIVMRLHGMALRNKPEQTSHFLERASYSPKARTLSPRLKEKLTSRPMVSSSLALLFFYFGMIFSCKKQLYKRLCPSVGPWVHGFVRQAFLKKHNFK